MRIQVFPSAEDLGWTLAGELEPRIAESARQGRAFLLGCPGGRSPRPVYRGLANLCGERDTDLSALIVVMMDEYVVETAGSFDFVSADMHFSCRRFADDEILAVLNRGRPAAKRVKDANLWFPDPRDPAAFDKRIAAAGGIDFFILASGASDGHVGFNPRGSARDSGTRVVALSEQTRRDNMATFPEFADLAEVPIFGVTVGIDTIARLSKAAAMILLGVDKSAAFGRISKARGYDPTWPATIIADCRDSILMADREAAREACLPRSVTGG